MFMTLTVILGDLLEVDAIPFKLYIFLLRFSSEFFEKHKEMIETAIVLQTSLKQSGFLIASALVEN